MVSKKKRPPPAIEASDPATKKTKISEGAGTSTASNSNSPAKLPKSSGRATAKTKTKNAEDKPEQEETNLPENHPSGNDFPDWSQADLLELMKRMERLIPPTDQLRHSSQAERLDWSAVAFGDHSAQECKETWMKVQKRQRQFRLLREVLEDAKTWAAKPWTHFYRSSKTNRHPDMPRRPLSTYMLFYMAMKDKVAKENPGLEMTEVSKHIAEMYKNLPEKKKKKYVDMAVLQRQQYEQKIQEFYQEHPELVPKHDKHDNKHPEVGPKKPLPPFKLFCEDKLKLLQNDPEFDKNSFLEKCREQWRNMPDKKKVVWINWACEEEARYMEELKAYMSENPEFVPGTVKTLTKEEKTLRERVAGKPDKPPNSGYSLFSRLMLASEHIKEFAPKLRMIEISRMWKNMPDSQKMKYQEQVNHMLDQYKLEYATYLESLPEDKRQEELQNNLPKPRKNATAKTKAVEVEKKKATKTKASKAKVENTGLFKGEPEPPPKNGYGLFVKALANAKGHAYSEKEAPKLWQMLGESDKQKYRKKLSEMKSKYLQDYDKFLNNLPPDELKKVCARKEALKKEGADASEDSAKEDDESSSSSEEEEKEDDDDDEEEEEDEEEGEGEDQEEDEESGSDDSSSDSESGSSDSSDSNDGDSKNSGDSSSSGSDSE